MDIGSSCVMCIFLSLCGELHPTYVPGTKEKSKKSCPNPVHKYIPKIPYSPGHKHHPNNKVQRFFTVTFFSFSMLESN